MDDPKQFPFEEPPGDHQENPREQSAGSATDPTLQSPAEPVSDISPNELPNGDGLRNGTLDLAPEVKADVTQERFGLQSTSPTREDRLRKRSLRHNLLLLLSLTLAAFVLTAWILVRVDSPFGVFSAGPREIVRAQLQALNRGDLRPAYEMLSARYRQQVSFDLWRQLVVSHWGMFHAEVVRAGEPAKSGPGVTLDIHLRGADEKGYRARFVLIRVDGRWWIDDVHWAEEPDEHLTLRT